LDDLVERFDYQSGGVARAPLPQEKSRIVQIGGCEPQQVGDRQA
jgi:hypothetical protein